MPEGDLYEQIIAAVDGVEGGHEGRRALHTKGSWYEGTFTASPRAAELSSAFHLQGEPVAALIRFSNASGNPEANDGAREGRGFAVKLRGAGDAQETDILATTSPAFVTRTPEDFLELMLLRRPDPDTGKPDFERLGAWLGEHPESQTAIQATLGAEPLASFATSPYYSPHTFFLVDGDGERTAVRYRWIPEAGEQRISDDEAGERGRDYLHAELPERLASGPVAFELRLQLPEDGDPLDDATAVWPDEREQVAAGRLEIERPVDDPEREDHIDVFDPLRLVDGIEACDDPILHARRKAYSVSAYRRWGRPPGPPPGE
jgi:catalase